MRKDCLMDVEFGQTIHTMVKFFLEIGTTVTQLHHLVRDSTVARAQHIQLSKLHISSQVMINLMQTRCSQLMKNDLDVVFQVSSVAPVGSS